MSWFFWKLSPHFSRPPELYLLLAYCWHLIPAMSAACPYLASPEALSGFSLCLRVRQDLNLGLTAVCGDVWLKSHEVEGKICVCFWIKIMKVVNSPKGCKSFPKVLNSCPWVYSVYSCAICFLPPPELLVCRVEVSGESWQFLSCWKLKAYLRDQAKRCLGIRRPCWGWLCCPYLHTPASHTEPVMESPLARRGWNFGLGAGTFLHLLCCSPFSAAWRGGGWGKWSWLFLCLCRKMCRCHTGWLSHSYCPRR